MKAQVPTVTICADGSYFLGDEAEYGDHREIVIYWPNGKKSLWAIVVMEAP